MASVARDTERQSDIKAIHGQVEAYHTQNGKYPTLSDINDSDWRVVTNYPCFRKRGASD